MNKILAIKGDKERGNEVIALLEMMGGINVCNLDGKHAILWISSRNNYICNKVLEFEPTPNFEIFTLDEFYAKYPYKVGDKTVYEDDNDIVVISEIKWDDTVGDIFYNMKRIGENDCFLCPPELLKPYKETNMNEDGYQETLETEVFGYTIDDVIFTNDTGWIKINKKLWDCYTEEHVYEGVGVINGDEYEDIRHHNVTGKLQLGHLKNCKNVDVVRCVNAITDDIMINQITNKVSVIKFKPDVCDDKIELQLGDYDIEVRDGKTYVVKKKPVYPKDYKECCDILGIYHNRNSVCNGLTHKATNYDLKLFSLLEAFRQLKICRDAYWKIAGEEMGLGKPWEHNYLKDANTIRYAIYNTGDEIVKLDGKLYRNYILCFPTEEMCNTFYENFKDLIEYCKEML